MTNISTALLVDDTVVNENDIGNLIQYKQFLNYVNTSELEVDLAYMNECKIKECPWEMIYNFNEALLRCKQFHGYSVLTILSMISQEFIDPSKIKKFINVDVQWELIDEVRKKYPKIKATFLEDHNLNDILFK